LFIFDYKYKFCIVNTSYHHVWYSIINNNSIFSATDFNFGTLLKWIKYNKSQKDSESTIYLWLWRSSRCYCTLLVGFDRIFSYISLIREIGCKKECLISFVLVLVFVCRFSISSTSTSRNLMIITPFFNHVRVLEKLASNNVHVEDATNGDGCEMVWLSSAWIWYLKFSFRR
jgi:hypothetical protein